ncbi:hypothetical protein Moror_16679 [Moniliophthora roreri MCA 2997]|uniref:Uncharacterized protein n=1 Tax=Moniliophthora roreri (strain MCA 2997) TaxID=1381753 RepID=V2X1A9_MONRO|nr:hypothetical protein Moror_16679 [Moniliophthora roreri MCA 2997]
MAGSKRHKPTRRHDDNATSDINSEEEEASQPPCKRTSTSTSHKFTTIPGSLVAVERALSQGKDVIGLHQHSLSGKTTAMLMLYCSILVFEDALKEDYKPR